MSVPQPVRLPMVLEAGCVDSEVTRLHQYLVRAADRM